MKEIIASIFIFSFIVLAANVSGQGCMTGADDPEKNSIADCNGSVEIGELLSYIESWYSCSECVPDLFQAIEAYYDEPVCISCGLPAVPEDYVSWWRLDTETSGMTPDEAGFNDGRLMNGSAIITDPERDQVASFDGIDDHIEIPGSVEDYKLNEFTITAWAKRMGDGTGSFPGIVNNGRDFGFMIAWLDNGEVGGYVSIGAAAWQNIASVQPDNEWRFIALTYDGDAMFLYIDAVLEGSMSVGQIDYTSTSDLKIGRYESFSPDYFNGLIDDVMIFNRSLDAGELDQIYDSQNQCGSDADCDDGNGCTVDTCDPSDPGADLRGCVMESATAASPCDDGLFCTELDACDGSGNCLGSPVVCPDDAVACTDDVCNEDLDACESAPNNDNCAYPQEICDVIAGCVQNPCHGISLCNDYLDPGNCTGNPCGIAGTCHWNSTTTACEEKAISEDCTVWVDNQSTTGGSGTIDDPYHRQGNDILDVGSPGDVICLSDGHYGQISVSGRHNSDYITITAQPGHTPMLKYISMGDCSKWKISGLTISPEFTQPFSTLGYLVDVRGSDIIIENNSVFSVKDASSWDASEWTSLASSGILVFGNGMIVRNNSLRNLDFGMGAIGENIVVEHNYVNHLAGDGIQGGANNFTIQYNTFKNFYQVSGNHDDGIQLFPGDIRDVVIRGNKIIQKDPHITKLTGEMQGIGCFAPPYYNVLIENNVVIVTHAHGIALYGAVDSTITNNIAFHAFLTPTYSNGVWIHTGWTGVNTVIRNNMANLIIPDGTNMTVDNNIDIDDVGADTLFVDYLNNDLRHKEGSPAIDAGSGLLAPATDILGTIRPVDGDGNGTAEYDIGAYEYVP